MNKLNKAQEKRFEKEFAVLEIELLELIRLKKWERYERWKTKLERTVSKEIDKAVKKERERVDGKWYDALIKIHKERPTEYSGMVTSILKSMKMGKFRPSN